MTHPRARDLGWIVGRQTPGPLNAITDVRGVCVGHTTLYTPEAAAVGDFPQIGLARTGVTAILPHGEDPFKEKVRAAVHTLNGFGKVAGFEQVRELGVLESPIALTSTLNVGLVADALVEYAIRRNPKIGVYTTTVNVVVGEIHDGYLNAAQGRHVQKEHVLAAIENAASGPVPEGNVGGGTGAVCFGWKGGIGTASRVLPEEMGSYTLGALVQANFGHWKDLTILGVPVGQHISPRQPPPFEVQNGGSVMVVLATDAPLDSRQLGRVCRRAAAGLARLGANYAHFSGDFVIAFSTALAIPHQPEHLVEKLPVVVDESRLMEGLFPAVADAVEEAVLNAFCAAKTTIGRQGNTAYALPLEQVTDLLRKYGRV
jgi:D-aminopeptidase